MDKKKIKLKLSGNIKKSISNIERAKTQGKNSVVIEKKINKFPNKKPSSFNRQGFSFGIFTLSGKITAFLGPILASALTFLISQRVGFGFSIVLLSLGLFLMIGVSYNNVKSIT